MGLFDEVLGGLEAQAGPHAALFAEISKLITESGGVNGLAQQFEQKGLGGLMSGWISNGGNPPITADQVIQVIGQDKITEIASKVGFTEPQVAEGITKLLPVMINHLTPAGAVPAAPAAPVATDCAVPVAADGTAPAAAAPADTTGNTLEQDALGLLKSKLFG